MKTKTPVATGGPYGEFNVQLEPVQVNEDIYLPSTGCYNFVLNDQYGDGFLCRSVHQCLWCNKWWITDEQYP
jgi:hypothetical protein